MVTDRHTARLIRYDPFSKAVLSVFQLGTFGNDRSGCCHQMLAVGNALFNVLLLAYKEQLDLVINRAAEAKSLAKFGAMDEWADGMRQLLLCMSHFKMPCDNVDEYNEHGENALLCLQESAWSLNRQGHIFVLDSDDSVAMKADRVASKWVWDTLAGHRKGGLPS